MVARSLALTLLAASIVTAHTRERPVQGPATLQVLWQFEAGG